jgi:hypothetical protein
MSFSPLTTAFEGSSGVEGVLMIMLAPSSSTQIKSVNVPPVSIPTTYFIPEPPFLILIEFNLGLSIIFEKLGPDVAIN